MEAGSIQQTIDSAVSTAFSDRIPKPSPDRPPLRVNSYEFMATANTSLSPFFPYMQRGAIVPCGSLFYGGPDANYGHFFHENTEEEIALVMGDHGAHKGSGMLMNAPLNHGVNSFLKNPQDPESFLFIVITQRQREAGPQSEKIYFRCGCNEVLFTHEFDATPADGYHPGKHLDLATGRGSAEAGIGFNADENARTCKRCGKVAPPFPQDSWGWSRHYYTYRYAMNAEKALSEAAREAGL